MDTEPQRWKGSGRAYHDHDLGAWLETVKQMGLVERGGGHRAAIGVGVLSEQINKLRAMAQQQPMPLVGYHEPKFEVIGELGDLRPEEWLAVMEDLEPYGSGNPAPLISLRKAKLVRVPTELRLKESGQVWAVKGEFRSGKETIVAVWRNLEKAKLLWNLGCILDLQLELSAKLFAGKIYYNWSVLDCEHAA